MDNQDLIVTVLSEIVRIVALSVPLAIAAYKGFVHLAKAHADSAASAIAAVITSVDRYHELHSRQEGQSEQIAQLKDDAAAIRKRVDEIFTLLVKNNERRM